MASDNFEAQRKPERIIFEYDDGTSWKIEKDFIQSIDIQQPDPISVTERPANPHPTITTYMFDPNHTMTIKYREKDV